MIAPSAAADHDPARAPSISLVLGAGGARGYAHIGVIEELLAQGYRIESIAGSSMGALIGGIYAAGKLDVYRDWVRPLQRLDVLRLLDWTFSGGGFIKGNRIIEVLRELIGEAEIGDLPITYTAVAVDLEAHREVWFSDGPLFDAIRASIAVPGVFRPHHHGGRLLVDGGLLNPLPVAPTLRDRTDYTLAVDVNAAVESLGPAASPAAGPATGEERSAEQVVEQLLPTTPREQTAPAGYREKLGSFLDSLRRHPRAAPQPGLFDLLARSLDTVQETITRLKLAAQPPDLLITVPRNAGAFYEFHRADDLIELGRSRTREALARWQPRVPDDPRAPGTE
ncbi:MAG TPA: patatin-like phospholipase family protein [Rhodanobacteraceae bacterium]|nr:patatin-like phospholipase family protein [Rhodanobacteraceae bacterium]